MIKKKKEGEAPEYLIDTCLEFLSFDLRDFKREGGRERNEKATDPIKNP